jgi:hypothetical protein
MDFIELEIDVQRNPKLVTRLVTVGTRYIIKIEPRATVDKDGGATVTLGEGGGVLHVVESYKTLKEKLLWS